MRALEQLYSEYSKDIYRYLFSLCRDASLSEDLTSEVFLAVVKSVGTFRGESDVKTWLFSIARHKWFEYLRKKKRTVETEALDEFVEPKPQGSSSVEKAFLTNELVKRIYELINEERELPRKVALMRIDGFSFYEIGKKFEISENSARVIFFRTKEKIRQKLKEEGYEYE